MCLIHDVLVNLPHDNRRRPALHITWAHAVLNTVGCVAELLHDADAATRQWDCEGPVAKAVQLAAEG